MSSGLYVVEVEVQEARVCAGQVEVQKAGVCAGQVEVKVELSDGSIFLLKRTDEDLAWMMKKLVDGFPDDREILSSRLLNALLKVRAAEQISDPQVKVQEVHKLLNIIINLPCKISQSEPVLTFFEPSKVDQTLRKPGQILWTGDETLKTEDQTLSTKDQTIRTEDQNLTTKDHTRRTECQNLRTEVQTLRTEDQILKTEDQNLSPKDQTLRTEYQNLSTKDQTLRTEDQNLRTENQTIKTETQTVRTEDQTIRIEDQIIRMEDQTLRSEDQIQRTEDQAFRPEDYLVSRAFQSLSHSEVLRSNGFCLANTETILFDLTLPTPEISQSDDIRGRRDDGEAGEEAELKAQDEPTSFLYSVDLTSYLEQSWTLLDSPETDILN